MGSHVPKFPGDTRPDSTPYWPCCFATVLMGWLLAEKRLGCPGHRRYRRLRRVLVADDPIGRPWKCVAGLQARSGQWLSCVQRGRMRLMPCDPGPAGANPARWRAGHSLAIRDVL